MESSPLSCGRCGEVLGIGDIACATCGSTAPDIDPTVVRGGLEIFEGKWALGDKIGEGGMGSVFVATDLQLDRKVAIKTLSKAICQDPSMVARFEREAKMMAKLDHPNLVPVHAVGRQNDVPFIVMKLLEGTNLSDHLRNSGRLAMQQVLLIMKQVCAGLSFVHARHVIHRDIKPANIFLSPEGHVTLLDLGVAHDPKTSTTRSGMMIGTPRYMSPEQILGGKIDHRSDLYALGVVLYEMLVGRPPFDADSDFSVMKAHTDAAVPDPAADATLPKAVGVVAMRALAKHPDERFQTADELLQALEAAARSNPRLSGPTGVNTRQRGTKPRATPAPVLDPPAPAPGRVSSPNVGSPSGVNAARATALDLPAGGPAPAPANSLVEASAFARPSKAPMIAALAGVVLLAALGTVFLLGRGGPPRAIPFEVVPPPPEQPAVAKVEPATADPSEPARIEPAKAEPAKVDPAKAEPAKAEDPRPAPAKVAAVHNPAQLPPGVEPRRGTAKPTDPRKVKPVAAVPAAPAEVLVSVTVGGAPSWAWLDVDGLRQGATPKKLKLEPGKHLIHLERAGFKPIDREVIVSKGEIKKMPLQLEKQ